MFHRDQRPASKSGIIDLPTPKASARQACLRQPPPLLKLPPSLKAIADKMVDKMAGQDGPADIKNIPTHLL
jgi:hypothetical protein